MVAFRDSSTATFAGTSSTTTISAPAALVAGDLMLLFVGINSNATISTPTGWTALDADIATGSGDLPGSASFYKVAVSGDVGATYTITQSLTQIGELSLLAYSNAAVDVHAVGHTTGNATSVTDGTVTTTAASEILVHSFSFRGSSGITTTLTLGTGLTSRANIQNDRQTLAVGDVAQASAGTSIARSCSGSSTGGWVWNVVALKTPPTTTAVSGSVTAEQVLAGSLSVLTLVPTTGSTKAEFTLAATLSVTFSGSLKAEQTLAGTLSVQTPLSAWTTDDIERTDLPFELDGLLDVTPVEDPPPASDPYIQQVSETYPAPTLVSGRPQNWQPTSTVRQDWGRLQLVVGGVDLSRPRGVEFLPLNDAHTEPFGDAEAAFALPGLTEFDDPAVWGLKALAPVTLRRKDPGGTFHTLYEGEVASLEPYTLPKGGDCVSIQCVGTLYRLDLLKEPPRLLVEAQDYGALIVQAFNDKRRRYNTNTGVMRPVTTSIQGVRNADFKPFLTGAIQDYLAEMTTSGGGQWTVSVARPRTPILTLKDTTTVHATVRYGQRGADVKLSKDFTTATTAVYGSGSNGHCTWMGARFPNLTEGSAPAFPLTVGAVFSAGDGHSGFAPFAAFLRRGQYGTIASDDTYLSADVDNVEQFQDRAGITVDGVVGAQTWEAAFQPGANQGSLRGGYVDSIYELAATRRRTYNAQGADVGPNANYDPTVPRIEDYIPFGDNVSKSLGRTSAKQTINRNYPAGRVGTITLTADPQEISRFDLYAGQNIKVKNYNGTDLLLHVTRRVRDWTTGTVTLTVDEKARDQLTAAAIHQRSKDVSDLTRRHNFGRTKSKVFDDYGAWLCEDGAGEIPLMNQQGGFWNVQRIAAAPKGTIARISLAMGSGLTEHVLNQATAHTISSVPGAARGAVLIFDSPVTANGIGDVPGMGTPITSLADGTSPVDHSQDRLNSMGLVYAAGGPGAAIGFYPNNDPGDGSATNLTGMFEDGGSVDFGPTGHYWLWVAIWTSTSCKVGGRIFPGAPA